MQNEGDCSHPGCWAVGRTQGGQGAKHQSGRSILNTGCGAWPLTWVGPGSAPPASAPSLLVIGQVLVSPPLRAQLIGQGGAFRQIRLLPHSLPSSLLSLLPQGHRHWGLTHAGLSFPRNGWSLVKHVIYCLNTGQLWPSLPKIHAALPALPLTLPFLIPAPSPCCVILGEHSTSLSLRLLPC